MPPFIRAGLACKSKAMLLLETAIQNILLIDDDDDDCYIFRKALRELSDTIGLSCLHDCDGIKHELEANLPDIIFMDINMPKKNGFECLHEIRETGHFKKVPIVMYSSSNLSVHITAAYGYGANLFYRKPAEYKTLVLALKTILELDWSDPEDITIQHFKGGKYYPFELT